MHLRQGLKPASERLSKLVSEVLGLPANHPQVLMGMSAIQGLCIWYRSSRTVAERMFPELQFTPERIDWMAEFIADFSLAGMRALVQNKKG
jgi:hypothetical protein